MFYFILEGMGKRKNGVWEISLQLSPENAMEMFFTILESNLVDKKVNKNLTSWGHFYPPPKENRQKTAKMA